MDRAAEFAEVVLAAVEGNEAAFVRLYREVQPGLLRYLRGLVGEDAEDVASEAWLHIARDLRSYRGEGAGFRGWAATIARNRALDLLRRQRRRPSELTAIEYFDELAGVENTEGRAIQAAEMRAVIDWIARLPRDQAEAILLRVVMGLDAESAGRVVGKRAGAVRTAAHRGLRRLAEELEQNRAAGLPSRRSSERSWSSGVTLPGRTTPDGER
jgi:RNA polymerase sigma-70 factor (ECF subfamily)